MKSRIPADRRKPTRSFAGLPVVLLLGLLVGSCAGSPRLGGDAGLRVVSGGELPRPQSVDQALPTMPYYIGPSDLLTIDVFGFEELANREFQVDSSGRISVPLAGSINAAGLSPVELEAAIVTNLRQAHVRNPKVSVNIKQAGSKSITVDGQVRKPGVYPVTGATTLMRAIAKAEGTDEFTRLDEVVVFRTVDGKRYAALYDLGAIRHGAYADPDLYANDLVMVGDDRSRRLFRDVLTMASALASPLVIALDRVVN